jgi:hypothetical protein
MSLAKRGLFLALAAALPLSGCRDDIPSSVHGVFANKALERPSGIEGRWGDGDAALVIHERESGLFELEVTDDKEPVTYQIRFGRVGRELFWDLTADPQRAALGTWPVHVPARIRLEGDALEVSFLNGDRLRDGLEKGELSVAHAIVDDAVLLTAPTSEIEDFLAANAWREDLFAKPSRFERQ